MRTLRGSEVQLFEDRLMVTDLFKNAETVELIFPRGLNTKIVLILFNHCADIRVKFSVLL